MTDRRRGRYVSLCNARRVKLLVEQMEWTRERAIKFLADNVIRSYFDRVRGQFVIRSIPDTDDLWSLGLTIIVTLESKDNNLEIKHRASEWWYQELLKEAPTGLEK